MNPSTTTAAEPALLPVVAPVEELMAAANAVIDTEMEHEEKVRREAYEQGLKDCSAVFTRLLLGDLDKPATMPEMVRPLAQLMAATQRFVPESPARPGPGKVFTPTWQLPAAVREILNRALMTGFLERQGCYDQESGAVTIGHLHISHDFISLHKAMDQRMPREMRAAEDAAEMLGQLLRLKQRALEDGDVPAAAVAGIQL